MSISLTKTGDWNIVNKILNDLTVKLYPSFQATIDETGQMFVDKVKSHIDAQDLPWTPLSQKTIELKGGSQTILVETGFLRDNIQAIKIKESKDVYNIFVGALDSVTTPDGVSLSTLMTWIEYGTDRMVARPLMLPSYNEVKGKITTEALKVLKDLCSGKE